MPRAYSLQSSLFPLFPPVKTCLRTGLLRIAGRDQRGLSILSRQIFQEACVFAAAVAVPCPSLPDLSADIEVAVIIDIANNHIVSTESSVEHNSLYELCTATIDILPNIPARWRTLRKDGGILLFGREDIVVPITIKVRDGERMK